MKKHWFRNWLLGKEAFIDQDARKVLDSKKMTPEQKMSKIFEMYIDYFETENNSKTRENGFLNWVKINVVEGHRNRYTFVKNGKMVVDKEQYAAIFQEVAQSMFMENYLNLINLTSKIFRDENFNIKNLSDFDQRFLQHLVRTEDRHQNQSVEYTDFLMSVDLFTKQAKASKEQSMER